MSMGLVVGGGDEDRDDSGDNNIRQLFAADADARINREQLPFLFQIVGTNCFDTTLSRFIFILKIEKNDVLSLPLHITRSGHKWKIRWVKIITRPSYK